MKVIELYNKLCEIIPTSLSCPWDRDGLESCPEPEREVKRVLVALDTTNEVIEKAIEARADVIVSHHPLFFGGLGLRVMTPAAVQRTAFEKDRGTQTRAIVGTALLNIGYFQLHISTPFLSAR